MSLDALFGAATPFSTLGVELRYENLGRVLINWSAKDWARQRGGAGGRQQ
jgi:hypothetical protein